MPAVSLTAEQLHRHRLAARGYLLRGGQLWYVADDDLDRGLELRRVADWTGSPMDAWFHLVAHGFPTSEDDIFCSECEEAEVAFGEVCPSCSVQVVYETRGEMASDGMRGK